MNDRIMQEWKSFARAVLPPDVDPIQVIEMRRAFFAGARAMLNVVTMLSCEATSDDAGIVEVEMLSQELNDFGRRVGIGEF